MEAKTRGKGSGVIPAAVPQSVMYTLALRALCAQVGLPAPQPEYKFHPARKWRIDYYFERDGVRVGLEIEGGIYSGGRHTRPGGFMGDMEKYNEMSVAGIYLVRAKSTKLPTMETINILKRIFTNGGNKAI